MSTQQHITGNIYSETYELGEPFGTVVTYHVVTKNNQRRGLSDLIENSTPEDLRALADHLESKA